MKAIVFDKPGDLSVLQFKKDYPVPQPKSDEVLVRVKACSLNHLDLWVRNGVPAYGTVFPHISGCDIAGFVEDPNGAKGWKKGDEIVVSPGLSCGECETCHTGHENQCVKYTIIGAGPNGGFAELCAVPAKNLIRKPKNLSFEEAAAYPLVFVTAWHMLMTRGNLKKDQKVLILGGASGIGTAAIQIAKMRGAFVVATASTPALPEQGRGRPEKLAKLQNLGADAFINHATDNISKEIKTLTNGAGVDLVFEHIGPATWEHSIKSLKKGGVIVTCGATTGPKVETDLRYLFSRELSVHGCIMGTFAEFKAVTQKMEEGAFKPVVDSIFPLEKLSDAQVKMEARDVFGKIVIQITS